MRHSIRITRWVFGVVGAIVTSGAGAGGIVAALSVVRTEARAQAQAEVTERMKTVATIDAGQEGLKVRVVTLEQQVPQLRAEVYEQRLENRDIYRAIMERKRSQRFEGPPPAPPSRFDGGPP
jgi:hypothetical protein